MSTTTLDPSSQKWIKEGRGAGAGKGYKPWLTVRDLPSEGRSHRVWGVQSQRTHHLLSDLELAAFFLFDWNPAVTEFPLRLDDTLETAAEAGIRHPAVQGRVQVMSTDLVVDTNQPKNPRIAIQVKTTSDLFNPRTVEKLAGNPQQNAYVERYNRIVRYDWLAQHLFASINDVQEYATQWLWHYNHERPNMALGGYTPAQKLAGMAA